MRRRPQNSLLARAAMGLAVAATALLCAELGLRAAGLRPGYQADEIGGWRALPEQQDGLVRRREGGAFRLSTNADGLRSALPKARSPGRPRVAILGDSIAFGWGVSEGETLADGALRAFASSGRPEVELLNGAQPGYSTAQASRLFQAVISAYQPDLTVLFLPMHDHNLTLISDPEHLLGAKGPMRTVAVQLATRSRVYEALRRAIFPLADRPFLRSDEPSAEPRVPRVSEAERAASLDALRAAASSWGGAVALGHLPFADDQARGAAAPRAGLEWAEGYAAKNGLHIVDLRECCLSLGAAALLPDDPGHLSAAGNDFAGAALAKDLLRRPPLARP